jgi:hypothetical protein
LEWQRSLSSALEKLPRHGRRCDGAKNWSPSFVFGFVVLSLSWQATVSQTEDLVGNKRFLPFFAKQDGAEFHGKWPFGGNPPGLAPFSYEQWLSEVPLMEHKSRQSWREKVRKRISFATFYTKNDRFTKTGSGQT